MQTKVTVASVCSANKDSDTVSISLLHPHGPCPILRIAHTNTQGVVELISINLDLVLFAIGIKTLLEGLHDVHKYFTSCFNFS